MNLSALYIGIHRPWRIRNKNDPKTVIWEEFSQGAQTARPIFLLAGDEDEELPWILPRLDKEAEESKNVIIKNIHGDDIKVEMVFHPIGDGKVINFATGLFGAECTHCEFSPEECNNPEVAQNGFQSFQRDIISLDALYESLPKVKRGKNIGKIGTKTGKLTLIILF